MALRAGVRGEARAAAAARPVATVALPLLLSLAVLSLAACTSGGAASSSLSRAEIEQLVRSQGVEAQVVIPFEVGEEARAWLAETVPKKAPPARRLEILLHQLVDAEGLGIHYRAGYTGTADEVFASRKANCLGFMNLFIGLARSLGLTVYYVVVEEGQSFGREGDLVVVSDHIAAGYGPPHEMLLLDFVVGPPIDYRGLEPVSDRVALAKYYSNRGAEVLMAGDVAAALPWLEAAVALDPQLATSWVNLGVARRRISDLAGAEDAYRRALEADPRTHSAYHNLAALLRLRGREEEAFGLLALTDRMGTRNPYNYISLGDWSLEAGRLDDARRFYRHALILHGRDAEPYAALGELELAVGHPRKARRWLRKAERIDPEHRRVGELASLLATAGEPL